MKILILSWRCIKNPSAGGSEIYFHEMAKRWVKMGNRVTWFSPYFKGAKNQEIYEGVKIIRKGSRLSVYFQAFLQYVSGKLGSKFDVIIDIENGIPFFSPIYAHKPKIFLHIHHVHKDVWAREFQFPISFIGYFLETKVMPMFYRNKKVITLSPSSAQDIIREGMAREYPAIVNPGIEFYNRKKFAKTEEPMVLFLNRVKKYKGVETFLRAAKIFQDKNLKVDFIVAGSGEDIQECKEFAEKNKLRNVTFLGRVSEEKKREFMAKSWAFVNPSMKEGWGIVNIEANYAGTLSIGSDVGGIQDSIINNKTGLLFPQGDYVALADKLNLIISDKTLRRKLETGGLTWAKNFSWDKKAEEYFDIIKKSR